MLRRLGISDALPATAYTIRFLRQALLALTLLWIALKGYEPRDPVNHEFSSRAGPEVSKTVASVEDSDPSNVQTGISLICPLHPGS